MATENNKGIYTMKSMKSMKEKQKTFMLFMPFMVNFLSKTGI
jgi:hypothetical protein